MSTVDDLIKQQQSLDLVRLEVDGSKTAVNTIVDHQTGRGVSLVCPFPSLEVDLPVNFGKKAEGSLKRGTIHRIGVEDDPETGLPRLRLSVRSNDTEEEIPIELEGFEELQDRPTRVASAPTDVDFLVEAPQSASADQDYIGISSVTTVSNEPAWTSSWKDLPTPEEILDRARTRRKFRLSAAAAWFVICMFLGAGGYFVYSSQFVNLEKIRTALLGETLSEEQVQLALPTADEQAMATDEMVNEIAAVIDEVANDRQMGANSNPVGPQNGEAVPSSVVTEVAATEVAATEAEALLTEEIAEEIEEAVENEAVEIAAAEARVLLPTRWKPDYSTAYRVRNPHGVVVDVPGALVKREGWIESAKSHPMIRSVKAIQRETGARFIVYVNGDLPRFMTATKASGVSLKLYHDEPVLIGETEQVAVAD